MILSGISVFIKAILFSIRLFICIGLRELTQLEDEIKRDFGRIKNLDEYKRMYTRHIIIVSLLVNSGLKHIEALLNRANSGANHPNHFGILIHKYGEPTIKLIISEKKLSLENKNNTNKKKKNK